MPSQTNARMLGVLIVPGNEIQVCRLLVSQLGIATISPLGLLSILEIPGAGRVRESCDCTRIRSSDAHKKADIIINSYGVSIKQTGASFSYNRIQRDKLISLLNHLSISNPDSVVKRIDNAVSDFHESKLQKRNQPWSTIFDESDFKTLLEFLMMKGSPSCLLSRFPADYILEAPPEPTDMSEINVLTFEDYYGNYREKFMIAIRRQWVGQASKSEHGRALGLASKLSNAPWVFEDVVGSPRTGWRRNWPVDQRRTVYFLMIEKIR